MVKTMLIFLKIFFIISTLFSFLLYSRLFGNRLQILANHCTIKLQPFPNKKSAKVGQSRPSYGGFGERTRNLEFLLILESFEVMNWLIFGGLFWTLCFWLARFYCSDGRIRTCLAQTGLENLQDYAFITLMLLLRFLAYSCLCMKF
jgi:hypothetical protein